MKNLLKIMLNFKQLLTLLYLQNSFSENNSHFFYKKICNFNKNIYNENNSYYIS